jgi:hypothetical protein
MEISPFIAAQHYPGTIDLVEIAAQLWPRIYIAIIGLRSMKS